MSGQPIDFRSDTLTQPTEAMRAAMAAAPVGDDVFDEDPTIHALQDRIAQLLGKEAALFVASGTMSNQIAISLHCQPGDEMICEAENHIVYYEQGGHARNYGVATRAVSGDRGAIQLDQVQHLIRPEDEHFPHTRLLSLENTHNRGAGRILPYNDVAEICRWAHENGLATHLDGARLMNAVVASGISAADWAQHFDTISICFSKGLGAPVGSALVGSRELIHKARRSRKVLGGGMRQAGIIAAGALYALEYHIERLAEDHDAAQQIASAIEQIQGLSLATPTVDTNIVVFEIDSQLGSAVDFCARLDAAGIRMLVVSRSTLRAVTHLDISASDLQRAIEIIRQTAADAATQKPFDAVPGKSYW